MAAVFVVDDSRTITAIISDILELNGHSTREFNESREALGLLEEETPDVILLDYYMPDIPAPDFLDRIKELELKKSPVIIILSGRHEKAAMRSVEGKGVSAYLMKPVDPDKLLELISELTG